MTAPDPLSAVKARIEALWTETPVAWPNGGWFVPVDPYSSAEPGADYDPDADPEQPWLYVELIGAGADCTVIGSPGKRAAVDDYVIMATVYVPVGTGDADSRRLCRAFGDIFRLARFGGVVAGAPSPPGNGDKGDDDGLWWRRSVSIPLFVRYSV
jgi:hypothetical protein